MEDILREYEVRLVDGQGRVMLVVPVIAASEAGARALAAPLAAREAAADFVIRPQLGSHRYPARKSTAPDT